MLGPESRPPSTRSRWSPSQRSLFLVTLASLAVASLTCDDDSAAGPEPGNGDLTEGREIFRFETFGNETFWTDTLRMHEVVQTSVDPTTALGVGLKVDADELPAEVVEGIRNGTISLTDPATTVALLELDAVVGLKGTVTTVSGQKTPKNSISPA